jgi:hypothetical protein
MKKPPKTSVIYFALAIIVVVFIYFPKTTKKASEEENPTLTEKAILTDTYLNNVVYYSENDKKDESIYNIRRAIKNLKELQNDVDLNSYERINASIMDLESIQDKILADKLDKKEMFRSFENVMNNLARAEMELSEMYAEINQMETASLTLKHCKVHLKNAILFHDYYQNNDSVQLAIEKQVFNEIDSLLETNSISPMTYATTLDKMIDEIDLILANK